MRNIIAVATIFFLPMRGESQGVERVSVVCNQVSGEWKLDSSACKGERLKLFHLFLKAIPDSMSTAFLVSKLGAPGKIQRYYKGYPVRKNFVSYIYYVYKDDCPDVQFEGFAISFVFDESAAHFVEVERIDYCN